MEKEKVTYEELMEIYYDALDAEDRLLNKLRSDYRTLHPEKQEKLRSLLRELLFL